MAPLSLAMPPPLCSALALPSSFRSLPALVSKAGAASVFASAGAFSTTYYADKVAEFDALDGPSERARLSITDDFLGRAVEPAEHG